MSLLNSHFDIITEDPHPNALAGLMVMLGVANPPAPGPEEHLPRVRFIREWLSL
jgi:hypothetical protein